MAAPKLVVALVELREEVQALWLPCPAAEILKNELMQVVPRALSSPDLPSCISSLIIEPRHPLIPLAELTVQTGFPTLITMGSQSVMDEEEVQKLQSDNSSTADLQYANLTAENAEVNAGEKPNVWVGFTMPQGNEGNWMVVRLSSLQGYDVKAIFTSLSRASMAPEEGKTEESPSIKPKPQGPIDPYIGKTPEEAKARFLDEIKLDYIHPPYFSLENLSDMGEMLVYFLCQMQRICKSAVGKFQQVLPYLGPSEPVDVPRLEASLRSFSLSVPKIDSDPIAFPQVRRLQTSIRNLKDSSDQFTAILKDTCTAFSRLQLPSRPSTLYLDLRRTEAGPEVYLVNPSDAALVGSVRYMSGAGVPMSVYPDVRVEGRSSLACLKGNQYEEWKKAGLAKMEVVGGLGIDV